MATSPQPLVTVDALNDTNGTTKGAQPWGGEERKNTAHHYSFVVANLKSAESEKYKEMSGRVGDWAFKAFTAGLGVVTIYLTATFSVNVYRGLSWHNTQTKLKEQSQDQQ